MVFIELTDTDTVTSVEDHTDNASTYVSGKEVVNIKNEEIIMLDDRDSMGRFVMSKDHLKRNIARVEYDVITSSGSNWQL